MTGDVSETEAAGLRERKKDATRRALSEAALDLAIRHGYDGFTIAELTDSVGVSRRTFSNYFAGKAECLVAITEHWLADIFLDIRTAPAGEPIDVTLKSTLLTVAEVMPETWGRLLSVMPDAPEVQAEVRAMDARLVGLAADVLAERIGTDRTDLRVELVASFGINAGRICLDRWIDGGRVGGVAGLADLLDRAFAVLDLAALDGPGAD